MTTGKNPSALMPPQLTSCCTWAKLRSPDGGTCDDSVWAGFRLVGDLMGAFRADDTTHGLSNLGYYHHLERAPKRTLPLDWATRVKSFHRSLPQRTSKFLAALNASSTALNTAKNSADKVTFDDDDEDDDDDDDDDEEDGLF